jgi:hypothetical protein
MVRSETQWPLTCNQLGNSSSGERRRRVSFQMRRVTE